MKRIVTAMLILAAVVGVSFWYIHSKKHRTLEPDARAVDPTAPELFASNKPNSPNDAIASRAAPRTDGSRNLIHPDPSILSNRSTTVANREQHLTSLYQTQIDFYGQVGDEKSNAIPAAQVRLMVGDRYPDGNTIYQRLSDENGFFSLTGVRGATIGVSALKDGYYPLEKGVLGFTYARTPQETDVAIPTADSPAILVLKRKGTAETLVHLTDRSFPVSKDGTPFQINLAAPGMTPSLLNVEMRVFDEKTNAAGHYDWRCSLSIPGGGFIERNGRFEFEAPPDGYQEFLEFTVFANALTWRVSLQKEFFVRFSDNRFARLSFHLSTRRKRNVTIESFLNPTPGSRNLEDDAAKLIEVSQLATAPE